MLPVNFIVQLPILGVETAWVCKGSNHPQNIIKPATKTAIPAHQI